MHTALAEPSYAWVPAAPFRALVRHLMVSADIPWAAVAYKAGVPQSSVRTLLFGRSGHFRPRIAPEIAEALLGLQPHDLQRIKTTFVNAHAASSRIRCLRGHGVSWELIADHLGITVNQCRDIAHGYVTTCTALVEILANVACENLGLEHTFFVRAPITPGRIG